ncbi:MULTISPECIES: signal peptidase I [Pontibacillus]|uniref:Signal peptidase I n=1 Tax=Pontibacillus chungwhensis TaxID=265426 RepID=A0ABY8UVK1_9BACI|nr:MULTISPECIES: signal peptidase I [Pontibacillus]MCD5323401.1 signal peptidase I [Pontibacillus sp. HN14]WIF96781.1 signal peptidase I [Pontibacillus chungwhensis]
MSKNEIAKEVISWSKVIVFVLVFSVAITTFLLQPFKVSGQSMEPTLDGMDLKEGDMKGDRLWVFKSAYTLGQQPDYKDIIVVDNRLDEERTLKDKVLESPVVSMILGSESQDNYWVKRVIGKPGDTLESKDGKLYRNGEVIQEDYIKEDMIGSFDKVVVSEGHVFVMGDNRNNSHDSRAVGAIPIDHLVGQVFLRFYPFDHIKTF